jgi:hypothetical protein
LSAVVANALAMIVKSATIYQTKTGLRNADIAAAERDVVKTTSGGGDAVRGLSRRRQCWERNELRDPASAPRKPMRMRSSDTSSNQRSIARFSSPLGGCIIGTAELARPAVRMAFVYPKA